MGQLLDLALQPKILNEAWKKLRGDKAEWQPGLSRNEMELNEVYHLCRLLEDLRTGSYRPHPVRRFTINKADGSKRMITAYSLRDKWVQKAVLLVLDPLGEQWFHPDSFAYRPGRTIQMAVAKARQQILCGFTWLVDADIEKFFDRIPHAELKRTVRKYLPDRALRGLIEAWLEAGAIHNGLLQKRRGLPQGAVISPFLCNLYLTALDQRLSSANLPFVRFADDLLLFAGDRDQAHRSLDFLGKELRRLGLTLNQRKTRVVRSGPQVVFLGQKLPKGLKTIHAPTVPKGNG